MLGVPQKTLETEYYVVDLPKLVREHQRQQAIRDLELLSIVSYPKMTEEGRKALFNDLRRRAGINDVLRAKFDRAKFEQLRAMMGQQKGEVTATNGERS